MGVVSLPPSLLRSLGGFEGGVGGGGARSPGAARGGLATRAGLDVFIVDENLASDGVAVVTEDIMVVVAVGGDGFECVQVLRQRAF